MATIHNLHEIVTTHVSTTAPVISDITNAGYRGVLVFINIDAISGTTGTAESVTVTIRGRDFDGTVYTILASAALVATGLVVLRVYPGLTAAANLTVSDVLPPVWDLLVATPSDGNQAYDYDLSFAYIP